MTDKIVIVDMQISNLASVLQALQQIGAPSHGLATPENIPTADAILLPGVGAFGDGMAGLRQKKLDEPIRRPPGAARRFSAICLGMQLLAQHSEEFGLHSGLGLLEGHVTRLKPTEKEFRVPYIGWCDVTATRPSTLFRRRRLAAIITCTATIWFRGINRWQPARSITEGTPHVVAVEAGNLFGVQFHPEKSQDDGLRVLASFFSALPGLRRTN